MEAGPIEIINDRKKCKKFLIKLSYMLVCFKGSLNGYLK